MGNSYKVLKGLGENFVDSDEKLNIVNELKVLFKEDRYKNDSIEDIKKIFQEIF